MRKEVSAPGSGKPNIRAAMPGPGPEPRQEVGQGQGPGQRPLLGMLWMVVTGLLFIGVTAAVKTIGPAVPAAEAAFLRYLLGLPFILPMLAAIRATHVTRRDMGWMSVRGVLHALAVGLWFYAMTRIPLAEVTAMNYLAPVYASIGAALFLGERLAFRRVLAIFAALAGTLIILRPGFRTIEPGHLAMMGAGLAFGFSYLMAKPLSDRLPPQVIVGMLSLTVTIGLAPFALMDWVTPSLPVLGGFLLVAAMATAGHYTMTLAFRAGPMSVTQPVTFLQLLWSVLVGALFFAEPADLWVIAGGVVILSSVLFLGWRERLAVRREASAHVRTQVPAPGHHS